MRCFIKEITKFYEGLDVLFSTYVPVIIYFCAGEELKKGKIDWCSGSYVELTGPETLEMVTEDYWKAS